MKNFKIIVLFSGFLLIAGMFINCTSTGDEVTVTARDVVDEDSLKEFVLAARDHLEGDYAQAIVDFREERQWKYEDIYIFGINREGAIIFHSENRDFEGLKLRSVFNRASRIDITSELLRAGFKTEGGFVEYEYPRPTTERREPKISYAISFRREGNEDAVVVSGFYPEDWY